MTSELDNNLQDQSKDLQDSNSDSFNRPSEDDQRDDRSSERSHRPRIQTHRPYSSDNQNRGRAFRPEGFGSNLQDSNAEETSPRPYRPRYNNTNEEGGYRPRYNNSGEQGGYQHRQQQGGYRPRYNNSNSNEEGGYKPRYNNNSGEQGGYQPRQQGGYRPRYNNSSSNEEGGYKPRYNNNSGEQGGYQSRQNQSGGYRPRYNNSNEEGGYKPRYNNSNEEGGYKPRYNNSNEEGGYKPRYNNSNEEGGYKPRYNNSGEGGSYQPRPRNNYRPSYSRDGEGGYQPRRQGGYNQDGYHQHSADYDPNAKYSLKKRIEYSQENIDPTIPIRLNKYLANAGVCSRREADEFILAGVVTVNGEAVTELGTKVMRTDEVKFNDQLVSLEKKVYVLLNKPKDYVTTSDDPEQRKTVMDLVKDACPERIYPVGRLDRNTTGVLLLTNDGDLASKLTHPKFLKKKVYHVFLDKNVTEHDMQQIAEGVELDDGEIHADAIEYANDIDKNQVGIEIHSGKNRIVRRIFESLGYRVIKLDRVQFAGLTKKNLRRGDWRFLTEKEVSMLRMGAFE